MSESPAPSFQCIDAIKVSLAIEKEGLAFYEKAAKRAVHREVRDIFSRLAAEEKEHIQTLREKAKHLQPAVSRRSENKDIDQFIVRSLKGKVFPRVPGKTPGLPEIHNDLEALDFGIESEKRSIEVLNCLLADEKKIDVRAIFMHLVVEEKKHLLALVELKENLSKS